MTLAGLDENDESAKISAESMAVNGGMEEVPNSTMRNRLSARILSYAVDSYSPQSQEEYINDGVRKALSKPPVFIACRENFPVAHI